MKIYKESLKLRQMDVKPAAKIMANHHIEKGNFKKTLDLLKFMGKKVKIDKASEKTSKAIWTIEATMEKSLEEAMLNEFSDAQLAQLKKAYADLDRINVTSPTYKKLKAMIANMDVKALEKVARAKVKFVSQIAAREYEKKSGNRLKAKDYMESVELEEGSREADIKKTISIMKKYPANKSKSEKELRKGAIAYIDQKKESVDEAALKTSDYPKGTSMSAQKFKDSQKKMSKKRALTTKDYPKGTSMSATAWKNRQEEVELDEAIDFRKAFMDIQSYAKKNGGMDKTDFEKVAYYVKAIGDNQNTPNVANKAFMLMKKHIAGLDTDVRDGIHMLLKKHGMIKNGRIVQESIELDEGWRSGGGGYRDPFKAARRDAKYKELSHEYEDEKKLARLKQMRKTQQQKPVKKESVEEMFEEAMLNEFSDAQLAQLKKAYANLDRINVTSPTYKKLKAMIANMDDKALEKVARAKVRFVSQIAAREYEKKSGNRLKAKDYMESVDEASILRTKTTRKQTDASKEKDKKKAIKTFQDIKKGKYPGVKIGEYAK